MEDKSQILDKIKSKYIFKVIVSFLPRKSYKLELFKYSKRFQDKFGIKLIDYKISHAINNKTIELNKYLSFNDNFKKEEDKAILINDLEKDLNNLNLDIDLKSFLECAFDYLNEDDINEDGIKLDIYSPFYDYFLKTGLKNKNIQLIIPVDKIKNFQLKNDYISVVEKLNTNSGIDFNHLWIDFIYNNYDDANYLTDLKFNFKLIKKLFLIQEKEKNTCNDNEKNQKGTSWDNFYKEIFSMPDIQNNLFALDLKIPKTYDSVEINLEEINNLKAIKHLILYNYNFKTPFILKLFNLKQLQLIGVKNISFDENTPYSIQVFFILESSINKPKELLNFPNLENFRFFSCSIANYINFKNLKKLNAIYTESYNLIKIKDDDISSLTSLKDIFIFEADTNNDGMIKKLLLIPNIENAVISGRIKSEDLKDIKGKNSSLKKLQMKGVHKECILDNFQKLFPNVNEIIVDSYKTPMEIHPWCGTCQMEQRGKSYKTNIVIEENKECITDKIRIIGGGCRVISVLCNSFENLKELTVDIENMISCLTAPIFHNEEKLIMKSLNTLCFRISRRSKDIFSGETLKLISDNVDYMPNLKSFKFSCCLSKFDEKIYLDLIKKLLVRNLDEIYLLIRIGRVNRADFYLGFTNEQNSYDHNVYERYSKKELLDLCKDKNIIIKNYSKIIIYKLKLNN